jgi:hypothetical protein
MVPPRVVVKGGMGGRRLARSFSRSAAAERLVNAIFIVIISELFLHESSDREIDAAFLAAGNDRDAALIVTNDPFLAAALIRSSPWRLGMPFPRSTIDVPTQRPEA